MHRLVRLAACLALSTALLPAARAADTFAGSIDLGDQLRRNADFPAAIAAYASAQTQAANDTERAIALSKKADLYAFSARDYAKARTEAEQALALTADPVGHVTALHALAEVQAKLDQNYPVATATLEKAVALPGVDWAQPNLLLSLGDAYRLGNRFEDALGAYNRLLARPAVDPNLQAIAHLNIGITQQYNLVNATAARAAYAQAVALNPGLKGEIDNHLSRLP
jgi:tetratricopeptide (TPR) repeat protein